MSFDRKRSGVLIGVAVLMTTLGACSGSSVQYAEQPVAEPQVFLTAVEQQWRTDMSKERVTRHKDFGCYFSRPEQSVNVDGLVFCGPVRHYVDANNKDELPEGYDRPDNAGDSGDGRDFSRGTGVWDTYRFSSSLVEDRYQLGTPVLDGIGTSAPTAAELVRPDGRTPPDDADRLAAPLPPPTDPGYIGDGGEDLKVKSVVKPKQGTVITPRTTVRVDEVGAADLITVSGDRRSAADGERFVVVKLTTSDGPHADEGSSRTWGSDDDTVNTDVTYSLQVGKDRKKLDIDSAGESGQARTLVLSVPKRADPQLVVSAAGKDQTLSLTTGERTSREPQGFYQGKVEAGISRQYATQRYAKGDFELTGTMTVSKARLSPFDPKRGWAKPGRAWLTLDAEQVSVNFGTDGLWDEYSIRLDRAKSAKVRGTSGREYRSLADQKGEEVEADNRDYSGDLRFVFDVDAKSREFDVTLSPTFTFSTEASDESPKSGVAALKPMTFKAAFD